MGISGLEDEYRLVGSQPRLLYVKEPSPDREPRLTALIEEMRQLDPPPKVFRTPEELAELVANDLALLLSARFGAARLQGAAPAARTSGTEAPAVRQAPPLPPTPLVGRDQDVTDTIDLLLRDDVRLVTLSGPGGIGKSRLAIEVAFRLQSEFSGGVVFARLASVSDPELVLPTIASAAGVQTEGSRSVFDTLVGEFVSKPTLVVLDNFEHVLAAAPALSQLLQECPFLTVLITSRAVLRLHGEWEHPVPPLTQDDAVRLFTERAVDARAGVPLTGPDAEAVAELCRRLDGLPLAIELAAARARLLPPAALLRRLSNRLDMLSGGPADLPERQQTLRSTIDWSYDLLEPAEQLLFARLSIFPGGWTLDSAEAVCGNDGVDDVLGIMSILLERSLIGLAESSEDGPRFRMLEVIREYAQERLLEMEPGDETMCRQVDYLRGLAHEAEPHLRDREARHWDAVLEEEIGNFRAAVNWLLERGEVRAAVDLIWAISIHLWTADHLQEARRWLEAAHGDEESLDERSKARLHFLLGATAYEQGGYDEAKAFMPQALEGFRAVGDRREQASSLTMLGATHPHFGDDDEAAACLHQAIDILRGIDEPWSLAFALNTLTALVARDDLNAAAVHAAEALDIAERILNEPLAAQSLMQLGYLALLRGDVAGARPILERSLMICRGLRFREGMANCLDALAAVALREGSPERAATSLGGSDALRESVGAHVWPLLRAEREAIVDGVRRRLGDTAYGRAWETGRTLSHAELISRAVETTHSVASTPA
jgi:predicted ATPase